MRRDDVNDDDVHVISLENRILRLNNVSKLDADINEINLLPFYYLIQSATIFPPIIIQYVLIV